jgi:uncharacterized protein (TIGR02246 family)
MRLPHAHDGGLLAATLGALVATACAQHDSRADSATFQVVADSANAALDSAFRRGDAAAATALMTDDVVLALECVPDWVGRDAVRTNLGQFFAGNAVAAFTLTPDEIEAYGDLAYERGTFTWASGPKGQPTSSPRQARYSLVRHRGPDGVWRIRRYLENSPERPTC